MSYAKTHYAGLADLQFPTYDCDEGDVVLVPADIFSEPTCESSCPEGYYLCNQEGGSPICMEPYEGLDVIGCSVSEPTTDGEEGTTDPTETASTSTETTPVTGGSAVTAAPPVVPVVVPVETPKKTPTWAFVAAGAATLLVAAALLR